jgi:hypothetical protein
LFRDESPFLSVSPIIDNLTFGYVVSLEIGLNGQQATLTWPADADGYQLQSTVTPGQPDNWFPVGESPVVSDGQKIVSLKISGSGTFFRLVKP